MMIGIKSKVFTAFFFSLALLLPVSLQAKVEAYSFDDAKQEEIYKKVIAELRCLVCQNQNLADSNAELAQDMRRKAYNMVVAGNTDKQIADFMVARYGDFVLYRPPFKSTTALLWLGPLLLFLMAITIVVVFIRKQKRAQDSGLSAQQKQQAHSLLDD